MSLRRRREEYNPLSLVTNWERVEHQWRVGPVSDRVLDAHDRSVLCMTVSGDKMVTGSADHGLKEHNIHTGKYLRELYTKNCGHKEWVTCVDYLSDGRVLSGAMDAQLCLWESSSRRCSVLPSGHRSSISSLQVDETDTAVTSAYDGVLLLWQLRHSVIRGPTSSFKGGHSKAVLSFCWKNSLIASAGRDSAVCMWDVNTSQLITKFRGHKQPVQCVELFSSSLDLCFSGSWDGEVRIWDLRSGKCEHVFDAHPGNHVNAMSVVGQEKDYTEERDVTGNGSVSGSERKVVTAGSDGLLQVINPSSGFRVEHTLRGHKDAVGCLCMRGNLCLSGAANGWVLVHDVDTSECLYGIGASKEAVRCVEVLPERACIGGDDGSVMVLDYFAEGM